MHLLLSVLLSASKLWSYLQRLWSLKQDLIDIFIGSALKWKKLMWCFYVRFHQCNSLKELLPMNLICYINLIWNSCKVKYECFCLVTYIIMHFKRRIYANVRVLSNFNSKRNHTNLMEVRFQWVRLKLWCAVSFVFLYTQF